jgi:predicted ATPase
VLTSITLRNFKSFGEEQTIPLQPITVLVGPNNSGKSNLVSLARFIRNVATDGPASAFEQEGGVDFVFHRPATGDGNVGIAWKVDEGLPSEHSSSAVLTRDGTGPQYVVASPDGVTAPAAGEALVHQVTGPFVGFQEIKLAISALRQDAEVVPEPELGNDGSSMASMIGLWRGANIDRAGELDAFIHKCLPEIARVLVKPGPVPGEQRLWIQQTDGEQFDAAHVSDGVLCFVALAMHAINAEPGALLFIEEPEQSIHPRRLGDLMDLFLRIVHEKRCQIVVVTHSPALLDRFREMPEAILLFRRGDYGTRVKPLNEFPALVDALHDAEPGEMLANGFFNEPF